ncbi:uncharacterized protein [Palaemon carinicauda]|uniref:uncharacterized protein n=1 Tax=Palaemon carinicauda TaxID=392227 RepID=UPI0035B5B423
MTTEAGVRSSVEGVVKQTRPHQIRFLFGPREIAEVNIEAINSKNWRPHHFQVLSIPQVLVKIIFPSAVHSFNFDSYKEKKMEAQRKLFKLCLAAVISAFILADLSLTSDLDDTGDDLSHYEIKFIKNERLRQSKGSFVLTEGLVISEADSFYKVVVDNLCTCRMACWSHSRCQAASTEPFEGKDLCRLSSEAPMFTNLTTLENATYFFYTSAIDNRFYGMQGDNHLYVFANHWATYPNSSNFCKRIPGHRLGIYETDDQLQAIENLFQLVGDKNNKQIWTDHQPKGENQYYKAGNFSSDQPEAFTVCQANPLRLPPRTDQSPDQSQTTHQ